MLQTNAVEKKTFALLKKLMTEPLLEPTRLVGGTSLALQLGHRKSTDLDLFGQDGLDIPEIVEMLNKKYGYNPQLLTDKTTIGFIDGIKIDVIVHPYKWLEEPLVEQNCRLAGLKDIAAMKLHAITNSGKRPKDFVDIAFLSTSFSYKQMKEMALEKYPIYDPIMIDRAIIYFNDVNKDNISEIKMIKTKLEWSRIERRIVALTDKPEHVFKTPPLV